MENQDKYVATIREQYVPRERTKLDELKDLDAKVNTPPSIMAYILGVIAALILGVGMCFALRVLGAALMTSTVSMVVGCIIGAVGIALCVANYFIYKAMLKSRKAKYGDRIIEISNELLNK